MPHYKSTFKGYHNLRKLSLLEDMAGTPLLCTHIHVFIHIILNHCTHAHGLLHTARNDVFIHVKWEATVSIPGTSGYSHWMLDDFISPKSQGHVPGVCEHRMCPKADPGSGQKQPEAWWGAGMRGGKAGAIRRWFPALVLTCHHQSIHQPKDSH